MMNTKTDHANAIDQEALEHLQRIVQRAEQGDASVLPELRRALDEHPEAWRRCGDVALEAQEAWLQLVAGRNLLLHECVQRKLEQLNQELAGEDPTPLERLLVARVVAGWLQTEYADAAYAEMKNPSPAQHAAAMRRQASAQQRYLQAIKTLATVRKLLRPPVSPVDLALRSLPETRAGRLPRQAVPAERVPVLN
jgi:hypothetical protein